MIDKHGMVKNMELETYSNDEGEFKLLFHQTPFGDMAEIRKMKITPNGFKGESGYKNTYFEDSMGNDELFYINNDKAVTWFYKVMGIK